ncbi:MAG TPA: hypothetical protein VGZ23_07795 [bacterium]|nr:hypothetical protein [bacterium]
METLATGPARLLMAHPNLIGYITSLGERNRAAMLAIPETLDRIREKARITDPRSATARAFDAACLLGYLAAISDTLLAAHFRMKAGDLPANALALRKLENALNGSTIGILLSIMDTATKAGHPPLNILFKAYTRHLRV